MSETKKGRPTTEASLKKLGFKVLAYDAARHHAQLEYKGQSTAMRGDSAKELLAIAKGWLEHVSSTS
jgi:ribosomal protein S13